MTPTDILRQQIAEVAERRVAADTLAADFKALQDKFTRDHAGVIADLKAAKDALAASDASARALALAVHGATGEKQLLDGVSIRMTTKITYDDVAALEWCQQTGMALIPQSVDRKALDKIAKATPLPFVTITEEPSATLASDLSAYLAAAPADVAPLTDTETAEIPF